MTAEQRPICSGVFARLIFHGTPSPSGIRFLRSAHGEFKQRINYPEQKSRLLRIARLGTSVAYEQPSVSGRNLFFWNFDPPMENRRPDGQRRFRAPVRDPVDRFRTGSQERYTVRI